jgi:hypothetical protein
MSAGRWIAALWIAWSVFGGLVFFVYRTTPRVVALQRAGSARGAADVLRHWRSSGQWPAARRNMTLDYGFIATFYPWMALAAWVWGRGIGWTAASTAAAAIAVIAGISDLVEDLALEFVVRSPTNFAAEIAAIGANVKFTLAPAALLFVAVAGGLLLRKNLM